MTIDPDTIIFAALALSVGSAIFVMGGGWIGLGLFALVLACIIGFAG